MFEAVNSSGVGGMIDLFLALANATDTRLRVAPPVYLPHDLSPNRRHTPALETVPTDSLAKLAGIATDLSAAARIHSVMRPHPCGICSLLKNCR